MIRIVFLLAFCAAVFLGFSLGSGRFSKKQEIQVIAQIHPEKEFPIRELKSFVIAFFAHNDEIWCEEALRSVFAQDYDHFRVLFIDDGSQDHTFEKVKEFVIANQQEHRVILTRNEVQLGALASFYRLANYCHDREVIVPLFLSDWLAGPNVLSSLNQAFQNPDVWIACGKTFSYPSYEALELPDWKTLKKGKKVDYQGLCAFYSALLKQFPLQQPFAKEFSLIPLLELAGGRVKNVFEPLAFRNSIFPRIDIPSISCHFAPLAVFPETNSTSYEANVVLFSKDRPLQLFSVLESMYQFGTGFSKIFVFFSASDPFFSAYEQLKVSFPEVTFLKEGKRFQSTTEYTLLGADECALKAPIDLSLCIGAMQKTQVDDFYLNAVELPKETLMLSDQLIAFTPKKAPSMFLIRRPSFKEYKHWKDALQKWTFKNKSALTFEEPKTVQLPPDCSEEYLVKFYQGFKFDLPSLEFEGPPDFIPR